MQFKNYFIYYIFAYLGILELFPNIVFSGFENGCIIEFEKY